MRSQQAKTRSWLVFTVALCVAIAAYGGYLRIFSETAENTNLAQVQRAFVLTWSASDKTLQRQLATDSPESLYDTMAAQRNEIVARRDAIQRVRTSAGNKPYVDGLIAIANTAVQQLDQVLTTWNIGGAPGATKLVKTAAFVKAHNTNIAKYRTLRERQAKDPALQQALLDEGVPTLSGK